MKRAVLIGINYYGQDCELGGCINDVTDMQQFLVACGYTDIALLRDYPAGEAAVAIAPTAANIMATLGQYAAATGPEDTLFVHYSGHGSNMRDQNGDERDGYDECICPVDMQTAGFIIDDDLHTTLVDGLAGGKLRAVFDSCHSGSVLDLQYRWLSGTKFYKENSHVENRDVIMISGCRDSQTSTDAQWAGRGNGALTKYVLAELGGRRSARWKDLCAHVDADLRTGGFHQTPCLSVCAPGDINKPIDI